MVTGDAVTGITRLEGQDGGPMDIGHAGRGGGAGRAGRRGRAAPVLVGSGTPFFPALDSGVSLTLLETRTFPDGVVLTSSETRR